MTDACVNHKAFESLDAAGRGYLERPNRSARYRTRRQGTRCQVWLAIVAAFALTAPIEAQETATFRARADLAVVRAGVVDDGKPVLTLTANDFQLLVDGLERPLSVFVPPQDGPVEIVLAIDSSGSMAAWPAKEAATILLDSLHADSCVLLMPFGEVLESGVWGHPKDAVLRRRIADIRFAGNEAIFDAMLASFVLVRQRDASIDSAPAASVSPSLTSLASELIRFRSVPRDDAAFEIPAPEGVCETEANAGSRRAVVVVTDGQDLASRSSLDDVLLTSWGSDVPLFVLAAEVSDHSGPGHFGTMRKLRQLLEYTGGALLRAPQRNRERVWSELQRLVSGLRSQYLLGFSPADEHVPPSAVRDRRRIEVRVRDRDYDVITADYIVRGDVATDTAALDMTRQALQAIAAGKFDSALNTLDAAAAIVNRPLPPLSGAIHYGKGIVYAQRGQFHSAVDELRRAAAAAPWLPDIEARQAEVFFRLGDLDLAWQHAIRGLAQGSDVGALLEGLRAAQGTSMGRTTAGARVVRLSISTRARGDAALQGLAVPSTFSTVAKALAESPTIVLVPGDGTANACPDSSDSPCLKLLVDIRRTREREGRVEVDVNLVLSEPDGKKLREVQFTLDDLSYEGDAPPAVRAVLHGLRSAIEQRVASAP